jgi:hypothetical protein
LQFDRLNWGWEVVLAAGGRSAEAMVAAVGVDKEGIFVLGMASGARTADTLGVGLEALISAKLVLVL